MTDHRAHTTPSATSRRAVLVAATGALLLAALLPTSAPAATSQWTPLALRDGSTADEAAVVRGVDGTLHVAMREAAPDGTFGIRHRTVTSAGRVSGSSLAASGWTSIVDPDLEFVGGTLHAIWAGVGSSTPDDPAAAGRAYSSARAGDRWVRAGDASSESTAAGSAGAIATAVAADGTPWLAFAAPGAIVTHAGLVRTGPERSISTAGAAAPALLRDSAGGLHLVWFSTDPAARGYLTRQVAPTLAPEAAALPGGRPTSGAPIPRTLRLSAATRTRVATGRGLGALTAFCQGTGTACTTIRVAGPRTTGLTHRPLAGAARPDTVWVGAGPEGRVWLGWADRAGTVWAVRSNRAFTRWGSAQRVGAPSGTTATTSLTGDGARGSLDVVATVTAAGRSRTWHRRVNPGLSVAPRVASVQADRLQVIRVLLTDAGDPVRGSVTFRGASHTTDGSGVATFVLPAGVAPGRYPLIGEKAGYTPARGTQAIRR